MLTAIKKNFTNLGFFYHATKNYDSLLVPNLETDTLPFIINDENVKKDTPTIKKEALDWLYKKSVEEMVIGLMESLIEAYKFVRILALSKSELEFQLTDLEEVRKQIFDEIEKFGAKAQKMNFPDLIKCIEEEIKKPLLLKKEVLSINAIRNCLVHRNGIVSILDLKNKPDESLRLFYIDFCFLL